MSQLIYPEVEVSYRQQRARAHYIESQRLVSVSGLRQVVGNTVIALGSSIHGMAQESCQDAATTRDMVRATLRKHTTSGVGI